MDRRQLITGLLATAHSNLLPLTGVAAGASGEDEPQPASDLRPHGSHSHFGLPAITYDQGMGTTDASGFVANLPLRAQGASQIWVNAEAGASSFNGLSPYPGYKMNGTGRNHQIGATGPGSADKAFGPKSTYADALNSVLPTIGGEGHQFFFAEGQTFTIDAISHGILLYHGIGASHPVCFQSYPADDPLNTAKHGRAGTGSQKSRPIWQLGTGMWPTNWRGDAVDYGGWVFRGIKWLSSGNGQFSMWIACQNNLLFENMVFDNVGLVLENTSRLSGFDVTSNNIIRHCAAYGQYDIHGAHACGVFSARTNLTIEDCIFWHCGWKVGVSRDTPVTEGGPDIFKHCLYLDSGRGTTCLVHRNVLIDGSAAGLSLRGDHVCHHNVIIDCPTPDFKSGGSGSDAESPKGVRQHAYCHLVLGGADINSGLPRMMGFSCSDGTADSYYAHCLYANNPGYGHVNNNWLAINNTIAAQITHMGFHNNRAYAFAPPWKRLTSSVGKNGSSSSIDITADIDNIMSANSPMTNEQIYSAIGYPTKLALVNAMIADPTKSWAYRILAVASKGFDFSFDYAMS